MKLMVSAYTDHQHRKPQLFLCCPVLTLNQVVHVKLASQYFSSASLLLHLVQVGKFELVFSFASRLLHVVGRSALLFTYDCLLLHLVGRSAGRHFSSHMILFFYMWSAGRHFSSRMTAFFYMWSAGRQVGTSLQI